MPAADQPLCHVAPRMAALVWLLNNFQHAGLAVCATVWTVRTKSPERGQFNNPGVLEPWLYFHTYVCRKSEEPWGEGTLR